MVSAAQVEMAGKVAGRVTPEQTGTVGLPPSKEKWHKSLLLQAVYLADFCF